MKIRCKHCGAMIRVSGSSQQITKAIEQHDRLFHRAADPHVEPMETTTVGPEERAVTRPRF